MAKYMLVNGNQTPVEVDVIPGRSPVKVKPGIANALYIGEVKDSDVASFRALSRVGLFLKVVHEKVATAAPSPEETVTGASIKGTPDKVQTPSESKEVESTESSEEVPQELTEDSRKALKEELLRGREVKSLTSQELKDVFFKLGLPIEEGKKLTREYAITSIEEV